MNNQIVATANHNRKIVEFVSAGQKSYKILQGKQYIGKTSNGGYTTKEAAIKAANR